MPTGFQSPNYTQVPNDLFERYMVEMTDAELRVVLALIRQTIGYHRKQVKFSMIDIKLMTGLSRHGVVEGAAAACRHGLLERLNHDSNQPAEWGIVLFDLPPGEGTQGRTSPQGRGTSPEGRGVLPPGEVCPGAKESINKDSNKKERVRKERTPTPPEVFLFRSVANTFPAKASYQTVIDAIQTIGKRLGREATAADLLPFLTAWTNKGWNPRNLAWLTDWAVPGNVPQGTKPAAKGNNTEFFKNLEIASKENNPWLPEKKLLKSSAT